MFNNCILLATILHFGSCHPAGEKLKLPQVNISNPYEINNLNYYNGDVDSDPGESKLFRRTVSNFEKSVNYLDKTVKQVESLINANSTLPRLTRGEILEIIENITQSDLENTKKNKTQDRDQKAIMLVMPYTPQNTDDAKMQELFTKRPVTRIISDAPQPGEADVKPINKRRRRPVPQIPKNGVFYGEVFKEPLPERTTETLANKSLTNYSKQEKVPTKQEISPAKQDKVVIKQEKIPVKQVRQKQKPPVVTQKPLRIKPSTTEKPKIIFNKWEPEIITGKPILDLSTEQTRIQQFSTQQPYRHVSTEISVNSNTQTNISVRRRRPSKSPQRHPNHKYPDEVQLTKSKEAIKIIESPKLKPEEHKQFSIKPEFITTKPDIFTIPTVHPPTPSQPHQFTTAKSTIPDVNLPEDLKTTLDELDLGDSVPKQPASFSLPHDVRTEILPNPPPLNENIRGLLASIGVLPSTTTNTPMPDIQHVADTLTPDMKELLMSFGLIPDPNNKPELVKNEPILGSSTAEVRPDSYVQFKPLPDSGPSRDEMEELLGRFGLGRNSKTRNQKALSVKEPEKVLSEVPRVEEGMFPESMKDVLSDLGLTNRDGKKIRSGSLQKTLDKEKSTEKQHVFNPKDKQDKTKSELEKLGQLLDIIKQLENLNSTEKEKNLSNTEIKKIQDLVGSFNKDEFASLDEQDQWAPDPLNYDYGLDKNEVKRQQNASATLAVQIGVSVGSSTTSTTTTTTEESRTPNIKDLEDSFGGAPDTQVEATLPPPTTTTKGPNTGFYYLLDWNTFLDIDDQKGKRVNLRFQPKAGDPSKFIAVNVP